MKLYSLSPLLHLACRLTIRLIIHYIYIICLSHLHVCRFFIAAIMAMNYARLAVFGGAVGALAVMTVLSAALGFALPTLLPPSYTHFASAVRYFIETFP